MPSPHFRVQIICRSDGKNVVNSIAYRSQSTLELTADTASSAGSGSVLAAVAYRAGDTLHATAEARGADAGAGERRVFDYSRKQGVVHSEILVPEHAPEWARDRQQLWNTVEAVERRKDAQLARDFIISLPRELDGDRQAQTSLALRFAQTYLVSRGMVADVNIHDVAARDGGRNVHAHITVTMRKMNAEGFESKKAREWNSRSLLQEWRGGWERMVNEELAARGIEARLSLKSYRDRGIDREPTKPLGIEANALEKRGIPTKRGDENRRIKERNAERELQTLYKQQQEANPSTPNQEQRQQADGNLEELRRGADAGALAEGNAGTDTGGRRQRGRFVPPAAGPGTPKSLPPAGTGERAAWYASFSLKLGSAMDAARDAVHRFRQKEQEPQGRPSQRTEERTEERTAAPRESERKPMSDRFRGMMDAMRSAMSRLAETGKAATERASQGYRGNEGAGQNTARQGQERTAGAQQQQGARQQASTSPAQDSARQDFQAKAAQMHATLAATGSSLQNSGVSLGGSSYRAPTPTPAAEPTQKAKGLSLGSDSSSSAPQVGTRSTAANSVQPVLDDRNASRDTTAQSGTRADLAARLGGANSPAVRAADTIMQQNQSTVRSSGTPEPPQSQQRQSATTQAGATPAASSSQQGRSDVQQRAAAMAEHTRGQDRSIAQQKEQTQQKEPER